MPPTADQRHHGGKPSCSPTARSLSDRSTPQPSSPQFARRLANPHNLTAAALIATGLLLALASLLGDSATYDETSHLTAGFSYFVTADFRLAPDHPPLPKLWAAWPLVLMRARWVPPDDPGWQKADVFLTGRRFLFELNDGPRMIIIARCMMLAVLLALWLAVYGTSRRLFGPNAGLLSLSLAALSPTLLAHGRLVTTDTPIALCVLLSLSCFSSLMRQATAGRLVAAAAAVGAAAVCKLSWPLMLPALLATALFTVLGPAPMSLAAVGVRGNSPAAHSCSTQHTRRSKACATILITLCLSATTWACIWTCYGWRASIFPADAGADQSNDSTASLLGQHWRRIVYQPDGTGRPGLLPAFLRLAAEHHLLPDAYLFGLAWASEATSGRNAYFCGQTGLGGWGWYFPLAFLIKTPIATMCLILAGIVALLLHRVRAGTDPGLLTGLCVFAAVYAAYAVSSRFNIGHRHLLPIYPPLFVLAGASACWLSTRIGRLLIALAVAWLAATNLRTFPHYLSYFNELVGGPARGHLYLADSNIDWGQDLLRLTRFAQRHPDQTIKLSYFGSAPPQAYGFQGLLLPSSIDTGSPEHLDGGGTYVISVTNLLGVYDEFAQDSFWDQPRTRESYRYLWELFSRKGESSVTGATGPADLRRHYLRLRWGRFLYNLRRRPPDERIGWSLFVWRLTPQDVERLTIP
jgi:hypothetical protein